MNRFSKRVKKRMQFWPPSMRTVLTPRSKGVKPKDTEVYYKKKQHIYPTILSVTEPHEVVHGERAVQKHVPKYLHRHTTDVDILTPTPYADAMEAKQDAEQREQELREVFNKAAMKYCENKPPKCYSGFNACLSCGLREICRLFNAE